MQYLARLVLPRSTAALAGIFALSALLAFSAAAAPRTVCTVTINSPDERDTLQRKLPAGDYRFVELVQRGRPDWLADACRQQVRCDALVISGHFDDGTEFYTDRFDDREFLTMHELQHAACSASCDSLFSQLKEVYLFGCNTLKSDPRFVAGDEVRRSLRRAGRGAAEIERQVALLSERYGQSNRDRLRHVFKDVPVLYGFSSAAPLGRTAGPLMERYLQSAPAGEVAGGRASAGLLNLFGPSSMIAVAGLTDADPHASFRRDMCTLAGEAPTAARKLAFVHEVLQRDASEVRMFLDHLERYMGTLGLAERRAPDVAATLQAITGDEAARERFLEFARDADEAGVQLRMAALARQFGWLTPEQERGEFLRMLSGRMARDRIGKTEVDLVCARPRDADMAQQVQASGAVRSGQVAQAAVLACLGLPSAHEQTLRALTSARDDDVAVAQVYLRHRPLADAVEVRSVAAGIARMSAAGAQVRALETLARQRLADAQSLQEIARLFPVARSLAVQRAIAGLLLRADTQQLPREELARSLQRHRLKSPDGSDVIDMLIRVLRST